MNYLLARTQFLNLFAAITLAVFIFAVDAQAAKVVQAKGKKVLINLETDTAKRGDIFYVVNEQGRRQAIIKIMQVKGKRAIAILGKGKVNPGWQLQSRSAKPDSSPSTSAENQQRISGRDPKPSGYAKTYWGAMAGFAMDKMDVTPTGSTETYNLSGTGYSIKGLLDYEIFPQVWFRGMLGMEQFNTASSDTCPDGKCNAEIMYLTGDLWGRYLFSLNQFRPWIGGGFDLLFPMSKKATALKEAKIINTSVFALGFGFDYILGNMVIPVQAEYALFPSSETVKASYISIRAGIGFEF